MTAVVPDQASRRPHPGFTLMEALMASAILFAAVLAVISAIMTGQEEAIEAQRRMQAALVADDLMGELATMTSNEAMAFPGTTPAGPFLARTITSVVNEDLPGVGVRVRGVHVHIDIVPSLTELSNVLAQADLFIPDPQP